jgi:hypothetical protein
MRAHLGDWEKAAERLQRSAGSSNSPEAASP